MNLGLLIACATLAEARTALVQMVTCGVLLTIYWMVRSGVRRIWVIGTLGLFVILAEAGLATNQWQLHNNIWKTQSRQKRFYIWYHCRGN
jgi:hypothetical protein